MTRSLFRLLILSTLSLAALPVCAQINQQQDLRPMNYQINGQVRYANGGGPVFNVTVQLDNFIGGGTVQVQTDRNGKFTFQNVTSPQSNVRVRVPGYYEEQQFVDLSAATSAYVIFTLKPDGTAVERTSAPAVIDPKVPAPAHREYDAALKEVNAGNGAKAIPHLEKAIELYKEFAEAHLLLGTIYIDQKEYKKAEVTLIQAIKLNPKSTAAYFALGEMYYQQKNYPGAERALVGGLQVDDNSWQGHYTLARLYLDANAADRALPHIEKANKLRPDYADAHITAANIYIKTKNAEGALKEFEAYLRLAPKGKFAQKAQENVAKLKEMVKKKE